jgi:purine-nucleoside phosphorylase
MLFGEFAGKKLMVLSGRFHYYEGRSLAEITYPIHVVDALNVKILIVTNAAGGINPQYKPGDLMIIEDHINFMGVNPLLGNANGNSGIKFIDMTQAYSGRLREKLDAAAEKLQMPIWRGVYLATTGPSYETPAEIKAFAWIGADAVGMSTVPEVIMARYHNIEVAGLSCITNLAAGISSKKLSHEEVLEVGRASQEKLGKLLGEFLGML